VPPSVGLGLFLFVFVFFIWFWASLHWLEFFMLRILDPLDFFYAPPALHGHLRWLRTFFYAPQYCLGTFNHWGLFRAPQELFGHFQSLKIFCTCPPVLFGHFHRWRLFMPPSIVWALSIIKDFFGTCPPSVGCDPSQGYFFKKHLLGSKGDCKGYISALWKDYKKWPFFISNACI